MGISFTWTCAIRIRYLKTLGLHCELDTNILWVRGACRISNLLEIVLETVSTSVWFQTISNIFVFNVLLPITGQMKLNIFGVLMNILHFAQFKFLLIFKINLILD